MTGVQTCALPISIPPTTTTTEAPQTSLLPTTTTSLPPLTTTTSILPTTTTTIPISQQITKEEAVAVATNPDVVKTLTAQQASEVFAAIDVSELTPDEAEQLVAAVQEAPAEVRKAFENEVNVFDGAVDTYVPIGSSVPISTRRVIIGVSAVVVFGAPPSSRRK